MGEFELQYRSLSSQILCDLAGVLIELAHLENIIGSFLPLVCCIE